MILYATLIIFNVQIETKHERFTAYKSIYITLCILTDMISTLFNKTAKYDYQIQLKFPKNAH